MTINELCASADGDCAGLDGRERRAKGTQPARHAARNSSGLGNADAKRQGLAEPRPPVARTNLRRPHKPS